MKSILKPALFLGILGNLILTAWALQAHASATYDTCNEKSFIAMVNYQDQSSKSDIIKAWKILVWNRLLKAKPISSSGNSIGYVFAAVNTGTEAESAARETVQALEKLPGVLVECNRLVHPLPGMSGSN